MQVDQQACSSEWQGEAVRQPVASVIQDRQDGCSDRKKCKYCYFSEFSTILSAGSFQHPLKRPQAPLNSV